MDTTEVGVAVGSFAMHQCLFRALEHSVKVSQLYRALQAQRAGKRLDASAVQDKQQRDDNKRLWSCYLSHLHCGITIVSCLCYWVSRPVDVYSPKYMVEVSARPQPRAAKQRGRSSGASSACMHARHAPCAGCMHAPPSACVRLTSHAPSDQQLRAVRVRGARPPARAGRAGVDARMPAQGPEDSGDEKWMRHTVSFSVGYFANDLLLMLMYPQVCAHACSCAGAHNHSQVAVLGLVAQVAPSTPPSLLLKAIMAAAAPGVGRAQMRAHGSSLRAHAHVTRAGHVGTRACVV